MNAADYFVVCVRVKELHREVEWITHGSLRSRGKALSCVFEGLVVAHIIHPLEKVRVSDKR